MNKTLFTPVLLAILLALTSTANAANNKDIIKHRQAVMAAVGGHFGSALASMRGMPQFEDNHAFHAESLVRLAKISADTFPAGSGDGKTKSLPAIWEKPEAFSKAMDDFIAQAEKFAVAAKADDAKAYGAAAKGLGQSCKGCHDDFKEK